MQFSYRARTRSGRAQSGRLTAADATAALLYLQERTLLVTALQTPRIWDRGVRLPPVGATADQTLVSFFRSFATLIAAGVPIQRALRVATERLHNGTFSQALRDVAHDLERGDALSAAISRQPRQFPPLLVAMVAAGEAGGILDDVLDRIATYLEHDRALRKTVTSALAYPATVLMTAVVLVVFLIVRVVPMFATMFAAFRVDLPPSTRLLLWLGNTLETPAPWFALLLAFSAGVFTMYRLRSTHRGRLRLDRWRLAIPIVGDLLSKTIQARVARMLGTLVRSGVELTRALEVLVPVTASPLYAASLARIAGSLRDGDALTPQVAASRLFDPMLVALIGVGEETGLLDAMLAKAAEYFEADVSATIATFGAIIEPVLIVALGFLVGFVVYSVFVPLYSLIGSVSK